MDKKILVATLYIKDGKPVKNNRDLTPIGELRTYAKLYNDSGIDKIFVFDLSDDDEEHERVCGCKQPCSLWQKPQNHGLERWFRASV